MFHSFVKPYKFLRTEPKFNDSEKSILENNLLGNEPLMNSIACPLHKAALRTPHIRGDYESYRNMSDFAPVTEIERKKMVLLERNLDYSVLLSKVDYASMRDGNENNTNKTTGGKLCGGFGDISQDNLPVFVAEKKQLKKDLRKVGMKFMEFPTLDMSNEFSTHWTRSAGTDCQINTFSIKNAKKFSMNHYKLDFLRYVELRDQGCSSGTRCSERAFAQMVEEVHENNKYMYELNYNDYREMRSAFEREYQFQKINDDESDIRHLFFKSPDMSQINVSFKKKQIPSQYGSTTVRETLGIDSRLLKKKNFQNLDCPPICIPSILRDGPADFHCVYFEGHNAMGQLENWLTIIIVRENERAEYVQRYASPNTYFVSLPDRTPIPDLTGVANTKGYSAGDSKYYCWRVSNWLHTLWKTPDSQRKCIIMDDQVAPFGHQVPNFRSNARFKPTSKKFKHFNETSGNRKNDQYRFRTTLFDEQGHNMMYLGNTRWYLPHAAVFMYMTKTCEIMDTAIVCMTSTITTRDFPLSRNPKSNVVWAIDLHKMNSVFHSSDDYHIEAPIIPAYQAGEDLFMHVLIKNRELRSVNLNTIRWRSETSGGGTCGRGGIKPFQPILKYHSLSNVLHWDWDDIIFRKVNKIPELSNKTSSDVVISELPIIWGADRIVYKYDNSAQKKQLMVVWVEKNGIIFKAMIEDVEEPCWFGDEDIADSKLSIYNAYAPRHIFTNIAVKLLIKCLEKQSNAKSTVPKKKAVPAEAPSEQDDWPHDLKHVGPIKLHNASVLKLRQECKLRGIKISSGAQTKTCISKLLDWKKTQQEGESKTADGQITCKRPVQKTPKSDLELRLAAKKSKKKWHEPKVGDRCCIVYKGRSSEYEDGVEKYEGIIERIKKVKTKSKTKLEITILFDDEDRETFLPGTFSKENFENISWWYV